MSHTHNPHAQPIETSHYTYAAHRPAALATRNLINQDPTQHSPTSPSGPTPPTHHQEHDHHSPNSPSQNHPEEQQHEQHPHPHPHPHHHRHPTHHQAPTSPDSTLTSDSIQFPPEFGTGSGNGNGSESGFAIPQRRQSWNRDEMKRGVMEGLLEKGKGKQDKGGYSSTS